MSYQGLTRIDLCNMGKIYDLESGEVIARLHGHEEEVLCLKQLSYRGKNYLISTSQDGHIIKWCMSADWRHLIGQERFADGVTCMAFTVSFVPHTGNRYFAGACDDKIKIYDFESCMVSYTLQWSVIQGALRL